MGLENEIQSFVQSKNNGCYNNKVIGFYLEVVSFSLLSKSWKLSKPGFSYPFL